MAAGFSFTADSASRISKMRWPDTWAREVIMMIQPSMRTGMLSMVR